MGKNPWEEDPDVAALAASMRAKSPKRWLRLFIGLLLVAGATFVAAYYIPLHRAHDKLRDEFQQLSERRRVLDQALADKEREFKKLEAEKATLQGKVDELDAADETRQKQLEDLRVSISSKLRGLETKRLAASTLAGERVRISLSNRAVFSPNTLTISKQTTSTLCDIAGAARGSQIRVVSVTSGSEAPSALAAKYASRRELSAARAAVVTDALEESCKVAGARMEPIGWLEDGDAKQWGIALPAIAIELSLPKQAAPAK